MKAKDREKSKNYFFLIYWNPDDKRIFVPKRHGIGWTFNFANPLSIVAFVLIILIVSLISRMFF